jgi:hypothetical protein
MRWVAPFDENAGDMSRAQSFPLHKRWRSWQ